MTIKLVTFDGAQNYESNYYAAQIANYFHTNAASNGYLDWGDRLEATLVGDNIIKIASGLLIIQGRMIAIEDSESLMITATRAENQVGYLVASIRPYDPDSNNFFGFTYKMSSDLESITFTQENTFYNPGNENRLYELPLYSFEFTNGTISNLLKVVEQASTTPPATDGVNVYVDDARVGELRFKKDPQTQIDEIVNRVYPIGSIYMSINPVNPSTIFGGSWTTWGAGRVPVGVSSGDPEFGSVEKTGGHRFLQEHTHSISVKSLEGTVTRDSGYGIIAPNGSPSVDATTASNIFFRGSHRAGGIGAGGSGGAYDLKINASHDHIAANTGTGDSQNLQPYVTCYMWKRTA